MVFNPIKNLGFSASAQLEPLRVLVGSLLRKFKRFKLDTYPILAALSAVTAYIMLVEIA